MKIMTIIGIVSFLLPACNNSEYDMKDFYKMYGSHDADISELIQKVSETKLYFGHRSVGKNMIAGLEQWEEETGVKIQKAESTDFASHADVPFVHFRVGSNSDPRSKIDDFVKFMEQVPADENPVAFFKLCYVDFNEHTDVDLIFSYYKEKMLYLKDSYPNVRFVACTVPLMGIQKGPKAIVKKIIGRQPTGILGNIVRNEFNTRLKAEMSGTFPVFDLGGIESTAPDGSAVTYTFKGNEYPCMPDYYTYDLGHLTAFGAKTLSYNLMAFLAEELQ